MFRPYWNYYHNFDRSELRQVLPARTRGQLVFMGILLAVYTGAVVLALVALS